MATTVEAIVNQALMAARRTRRIADIYEGSANSIVALELYGQARDELLDLRDWSFNRRVSSASLTLLKGPPPAGGYSYGTPWSNIYPAPGFLYEYAYPDDCIDLRAIIWPPGAMPDLDPRPSAYRIDNDPMPVVSGDPPVAAGPEAKVIYCNVTDAIAVYRSRVTDPALFDPAFVTALVDRLAVRFDKAFGAPLEVEREDRAEENALDNTDLDVRG